MLTLYFTHLIDPVCVPAISSDCCEEMSAGPYHFFSLGDTKECNNKCGYKLNLSYQPTSSGSTVCLPPPVMCNASTRAEVDNQDEYDVEIINNLDYAVTVTVTAIPSWSVNFPVLGENNEGISIPNSRQLRSVAARSDIRNINCKPFVSRHLLPPKDYAFAVNSRIGRPPCYVA